MDLIIGLNDIGIITYTLKLLCITIFSYYTALKITSNEEKIRITAYIKIIFIVMICGVIKYLLNFSVSIILLIMMLSMIISKTIQSSIGNSMLIITLSLSINYIIFLTATALAFIPIIIFKIEHIYISFFIIMVIYIILIKIFWNIRRFKKGFIFLQHKMIGNEYFDIAILNISVIILFLVVMLSNYTEVITGKIGVCFIIISIIMFITIQKSLQLYYK